MPTEVAVTRDAVQVMLCANYAHSGCDAGRLRACTIDENGPDAIEIESDLLANADDDPGYPLCTDAGGGRLRIGHMLLPIIGGRARWVGNWCWDQITVTPRNARRLANYLVQTRGWQVTMHVDGGRFVPWSIAKDDLSPWGNRDGE